MVTWVSGSIGLFAAGTILYLIRKDHLHARYGLWWVGVALAFACIGLYPRSIDELARLLGVAYGPVLALTLALTLVVIKVLIQDIERSRAETRLQRLAQRMAMLEAELRRVERGQMSAATQARPETDP